MILKCIENFLFDFKTTNFILILASIIRKDSMSTFDYSTIKKMFIYINNYWLKLEVREGFVEVDEVSCN